MMRSSRSKNTSAAYAVSGATANASTPASVPCHSGTAAATPIHVTGNSSIAASTLMLASASSAPLANPVATNPTAR